MTAILIHRSGSLEGQRIRLEQDLTRLGRKANNHVVLGEEVVSSYHAEIHRKGNSYYLLDLESTNGTFVNGRAAHKTRLKNRDKIEIGEGGPLIEFRHESKEEEQPPRICPLSGPWEKGMEAILLEHDRNTLGRGLENDIVVGRVPGSRVSSRHAVITVRSDLCELEDLDSSNGTLVNGKLIRKTQLRDGDRVELGSGGPVFEFHCRPPTGKHTKDDSRESERIFQKLERAAKGGRAGEQTMMFLQAAHKYYRRRRWPLMVMSGVILTAALAIGYLYFLKTKENRRIRDSAEEIFYRMRVIQAQLVRQRDVMPPDEFARQKKERERAEQAYEEFLEKLGIYKGKTPIQRAIMRLSRRLGETDLEVPPDFYQTTLTYVEKWRSTPRLRTSLDRARQRNLPQTIRKALDLYGLPREFLFLPLQESNYDLTSVGPPTDYGFAKGLWQLIPSTALEYHLRLGPLKDVAEYDPSDQRHDELASTQAAVRYLAFLYSTKAAASGLLVIASYNYGHARIIKKLDELPNDPRQRSFWNFYRNGWLPNETRDYVMSIFSAALICEKPELFQMNIEPIMQDW